MRFRIWDSDNEGFDYIDFNNLEETRQTIDSIESYFSSDYLKNNPEYLQRCTECKDNDGNIVYEGDYLDTINETGLVKWDNIGCKFIISFDEVCPSYSLNTFSSRDCRINGNIFKK